jgi:hypothetical protein
MAASFSISLQPFLLKGAGRGGDTPGFLRRATGFDHMMVNAKFTIRWWTPEIPIRGEAGVNPYNIHQIYLNSIKT